VAKVFFIINSSRKLSSTARLSLSLAEQSDKLEIQEFRTEHVNHAKEITSQEASNCDIVVAVGGDGTCNEVVQGLIESKVENTSIAILPNGTGNDFSRMLSAFDPEKFIHALEQNEGVSTDIGCCEFKEQTRYFLNIADIGFGAKVIQLMTNQRKMKLGGKLSYSLAIIRAFFSYRKPNIKIVW